MAWNDGLLGPSLDFASSDERVVRVLAGPGTGKTFALIRRIARLLEAGVEPDRLLVLTFARTAAQDLVRALDELGEAGYAAVRARTLHSYCFSLLGRAGVLMATGRHPRILLDFEKDAALWDLDGPFGGIRNRRTMAEAFEAAWARRQADEPGEPVVGLDQRFQDALRAWLRWHRGMLVGELVPEALAYLRHNPESTELDAYSQVLVDEYQDLNRAEQDLIDLLSSRGDLAVIGDDDQSIYSFKWANPEGIREFPGTHPGTYDVQLEECRRCPTGVVDLAISLLGRDATRPGTHRLLPLVGNGPGEIHNVQWPSIEAEAEGIARYLEHKVDAGTDEGQCLVLAPRRVIGYAVRDALSLLGYQAETYFQQQPVEKPQAQEVLTLLTLLANPDDRVALRAWLGFGSPDWRRAPYRRALAVARSDGLDVAQVLTDVASGARSLAYSAPLVERWRQLQAARTAFAGFSGDMNALIDRLLPDGVPDLFLLRKVALGVVADAGEEIADLVSLMRASIAQPEVPIESTRIRIMSFHKSKGLTAQVVALTGLVDGLMPQAADDGMTADEEAALMAEQRRLFYVGLTRTRRALVLSSEYQLPAAFVQQNRIRRGGWTGTGYRTFASTFLRELGPTLPAAVRGHEWTY